MRACKKIGWGGKAPGQPERGRARMIVETTFIVIHIYMSQLSLKLNTAVS